jgi:Bromodomain
MQAKLEDYGYATMEKLESDLKRLVQNAKEFNSTKSEVYEDAERIRKALSNFMPKHNPAYSDPAYRAYPTPLPGRTSDIRHNSTNTPAREVNGNTDSLKIKLPNIMGSRRKSSAQPTDEDDGPEDDMISKQTEIIDQMMELPNAELVFRPHTMAILADI